MTDDEKRLNTAIDAAFRAILAGDDDRARDSIAEAIAIDPSLARAVDRTDTAKGGK